MRAVRISRGGELDVGSEVLEARVRCRYVKGGFRMVIVLCAGCRVFSKCADGGDTASAETDVMAHEC